jgi:dTDP-4-dehydrorhamnose reductase
MPAKRKILVIGSGGMLGTDLCKELGSEYELGGIDIAENSGRAGLNLPYRRKSDITDLESISNIITDFKPDIVIHAAAWTDVDACELDGAKAYKVNTEGTKNVARACKASGAVLIYISTDFVFDGNKNTPYVETDETGPLGIYAESKLRGEEAVKKILNNYFIIRTGWLYGKSGKNFVDTIIAKAKTEKELKVVDDQTGSPTYTIDLAKAIHTLINVSVNSSRAGLNLPYHKLSTVYGIYHVSNAGSVSWFEYAKTILNLAESKTSVIPISSEELARPASRPTMSVLDNAKFTALTGYKMRDWKEALKAYLAHRNLNSGGAS